MRPGGLLLATVIAVYATAGAQEPDVGTDAQRAAGKRVYEKFCTQCHGENGDGGGVAEPYFHPRPRDFTYGLYKIRTTPSGELPTHDDLKRVIRRGMPYTGMPAWPQLSEEELDNVVYYLKTFTETFADPDFVVSPIDIPDAPRFSEESAEKGRAIYEENKCFDCHGDAGRGNGKSATTLTNDWEEPIRPADLTKRWTFRGGATREDIYRTFTTGLNGTPMPSYADLISEEDRWHLVDYVYSLSRDEPDYSTVLTAYGIDGDIDIERGAGLFAGADPAFFPVIGQIIEPGRNFYPGVNAIEARAVFNTDEIAFMLTWHDMAADTSGANSPLMPAPRFDPAAGFESPSGIYSDAVALQVPSRNPTGFVLPYFLFGDARNAVDLWHVDLAGSTGVVFVGRGRDDVEPSGEQFAVMSNWEDGAWTVVFKSRRRNAGGLSFEEGEFVPVAFSLWDGFNNERGSSRGVTSWYHVYMAPRETESNTLPVLGSGLLALLVEVFVIGVVRKANQATRS